MCSAATHQQQSCQEKSESEIRIEIKENCFKMKKKEREKTQIVDTILYTMYDLLTDCPCLTFFFFFLNNPQCFFTLLSLLPLTMLPAGWELEHLHSPTFVAHLQAPLSHLVC